MEGGINEGKQEWRNWRKWVRGKYREEVRR